MTDLISRELAIELLENTIAMTKKEERRRNYCVELIKAMPSAEPRWIPVSERMPEDGQYVLFCDIDEDIMLGYHVKGRPDTHFSQDGSWEDMKNVLAWMPLPKPYKRTDMRESE
jgi:hypothetical protein